MQSHVQSLHFFLWGQTNLQERPVRVSPSYPIQPGPSEGWWADLLHITDGRGRTGEIDFKNKVSACFASFRS